MGMITALLNGKALLVGAALLAVLGFGYGQVKGCQADKVKAELTAAQQTIKTLCAVHEADNVAASTVLAVQREIYAGSTEAAQTIAGTAKQDGYADPDSAVPPAIAGALHRMRYPAGSAASGNAARVDD